jgi:5-methylcytosine-specific restriction protein A
MNWLISANGKKYRHADAFNEIGYVDWRQTANYEIGDTAYIYSTRPLSKVQFKFTVEKNNMKFEEITDDKEFWIDLDEYYKYKDQLYSRLKLVDKVNIEALSLGKLKENGLKAAPQGPMRLKGDILKYVENFFSDQIVYPDEVDEDNLYEGTIVSVKVNKYERNKEARDKCIEYHGSKCCVCDFDFEKVYGELGKGFIHVHHIRPLSEIDKEYRWIIKKILYQYVLTVMLCFIRR